MATPSFTPFIGFLFIQLSYEKLYKAIGRHVGSDEKQTYAVSSILDAK
jgi:hypothetical protein